MDERRQLAKKLDDIQLQVKDLEIHYEKYFSGLEKREPYNERKDLSKKIRHFTNHRIVWTDLKFRHQNIASRLRSYEQYWDRILRLIDEGKYHRHKAKLNTASQQQSRTPKSIDSKVEATKLQQDLSQARKTCGLSGGGPSVERVAAFIASQREKILNQYGDKPVAFSIDTSGNKPRIKVSLKK